VVVDVQAVRVDAHEQLARLREARLDANRQQRDRMLGPDARERVVLELGKRQQLGARLLGALPGDAQAGPRRRQPRSQGGGRRARRALQLREDRERLGARGLDLGGERGEALAQLVEALAHGGRRSAARRQTRTGC
jgi:hypothetical protein